MAVSCEEDYCSKVLRRPDSHFLGCHCLWILSSKTHIRCRGRIRLERDPSEILPPVFTKRRQCQTALSPKARVYFTWEPFACEKNMPTLRSCYISLGPNSAASFVSTCANTLACLPSIAYGCSNSEAPSDTKRNHM